MKPLKSPLDRFSTSPLQQELNWRTLLFLGIAVCCLTDWVSPPVALILGILIALTLENPIPKASRPMAKYLLQTCIVLLGFSMNLAVVLQAGSRGALFAALSIGVTLWLGEQSRR